MHFCLSTFIIYASFVSPFSGAVGFLSVGSFVTAYLIPDGNVMISLAVAAWDGCGRDRTDVPPMTAAKEVDRNARRLSTAAPDAAAFDSPPADSENENDATPALPRRKRTAARRDFAMVNESGVKRELGEL